MSGNQRICFDRILPRDLLAPRPEETVEALPPEVSEAVRSMVRAAVFTRKRWANGSTLRVSFMEGTASQHAMVREFAPEWCKHANLQFDFGFDPGADIRIAFQDDGAWSYIGTDCRDIPRDQPTMNFGWLDEAVILHEFGHAIGLIHEHQNPQGGIQWNRANVIRDLSLPPNSWDLPTIESNIFAKYSRDQVNGTVVDRNSIMMYAFPASWTMDGFSTPENTKLSQQDKQFIAGQFGYPGVAGPTDGPTTLAVNGAAVQAEIGRPGEEDLFQFSLNAAGRYAVETSGNTDVYMSLYGPNSQTALIAQDDDSGPALNSRIVRWLNPGTYFVQIRHYNRQNGQGSYGIKVNSV